MTDTPAPLSSFSFVHTIRTRKNYEWAPLPDITAHELALAMPLLLASATGAYMDAETVVSELPKSVQRHFPERFAKPLSDRHAVGE